MHQYQFFDVVCLSHGSLGLILVHMNSQSNSVKVIVLRTACITILNIVRQM